MSNLAPFTLILRENPALSDADLDTVTHLFLSWMHRNTDVGGNTEGEGLMDADTWALRRFFQENLGRRLVAAQDGLEWYEGQIVEMAITLAGVTWVKSLERVYNRVKLIYSKIGPQLLANGDVEGGAWTQIGTPTTHAVTTDWFAKGTQAMHVVIDAADEGTEVESGVTIEASTDYDCYVVVEVVSGRWRLRVTDNATSAIIAENYALVSGRYWLECRIPNSNTYTSIDVELTCADAAGEIYADGAGLRKSAVRSETEWLEDSDSITQWGQKELIKIVKEMTDAEADGEAQRILAEHAWPRTKPVGSGEVYESDLPPDQLVVTCQGMVWTFTWRHTLIDDTDDGDGHITALVDESEFVASSDGFIDANASAEVTIDSSNPVQIWEAMKKVADTGDGAGATWLVQVKPGREIHYHARSSDITYEYRGGRLFWYSLGYVDPIQALPGWCEMTDHPELPKPQGSADEDDPRRAWLYETEFIYERQEDEHVTGLRWRYRTD